MKTSLRGIDLQSLQLQALFLDHFIFTTHNFQNCFLEFLSTERRAFIQRQIPLSKATYKRWIQVIYRWVSPHKSQLDLENVFYSTYFCFLTINNFECFVQFTDVDDLKFKQTT